MQCYSHHNLLGFKAAAGFPTLFCSPEDSWSWIPGSSNCLRCVNGKPTCAAGVCTGFPTSAAGDSSPGELAWVVVLLHACQGALNATYGFR